MDSLENRQKMWWIICPFTIINETNRMNRNDSQCALAQIATSKYDW